MKEGSKIKKKKLAFWERAQEQYLDKADLISVSISNMEFGTNGSILPLFL